LLVDDDHGLRTLLRTTFEVFDIEVEEAESALSAVESIAARRPDVVVLDVAMPRVDGLEAARRLLAVQPDARVVFLTANSSAAALREARELGAAGYLLKDLDPDDLCDAVRRVARGGTAWPDESEPDRKQVTQTLLSDTIRSDATSVVPERRGLWS